MKLQISNKAKTGNMGFTLVEIIVVIAILGIIMSILVPQYIRYIGISKEKVCEVNRAELLRSYEIAKIEKENLTLQNYFNNSEELAGIDNTKICPSGGTISLSEDGKGLVCSQHGKNNFDDNSHSSGSEKSDKSFYVSDGTDKYKIASLGDLETYEPDEYGETLPRTAVFLWKGDYYFLRDRQYLNVDTNRAELVDSYGVKIDTRGIKTPSRSSEPGDIKIKHGRLMVFHPYRRFHNDYKNGSYWFTLDSTKVS